MAKRKKTGGERAGVSPYVRYGKREFDYGRVPLHQAQRGVAPTRANIADWQRSLIARFGRGWAFQ